ncbi:MAG: HAD family hydrolase [Defluviitaleaceae bacterium]|nr:HAD family hydrolase [Defluviitaleaceae bacterium]MCL2238788.1 HAD family hydrolase [Defluviitaleaceae bacterium]
MSIKMIATDLDQTLLMSDKNISSFTKNILNACKQQGILITFATARTEIDCKSYAEEINPDAIVSSRGLLVKAGEDTISRFTLNVETTNKIILSCLEQSNVRYILAFTVKGTFTNIPADEHNTIWGKCNPEMYTDFSNGLDYEAYDIVAEIFDDATANIIAALFSMIDVKKISGQHWFSFGVKNANKSINKFDGIKSLATHFNIDLEDIVAFGDDFCDVEMLRGCGIGVAVDNAIDEVKNVADFICDSNDDDGVAKWISERIRYATY